MSGESRVVIEGHLKVYIVGNYRKAVTLMTCPVPGCEHEFAKHEPRWKHFLDEHDADDFER